MKAQKNDCGVWVPWETTRIGDDRVRAEIRIADTPEGYCMSCGYILRYEGSGCAPSDRLGRMYPTRGSALAAGLHAIKETLERRLTTLRSNHAYLLREGFDETSVGDSRIGITDAESVLQAVAAQIKDSTQLSLF